MSQTVRIVFLLLSVLSCFAAFGQTSSIDKLKSLIDTSPDSASKLNATLAFCEQWESYNPDTLKKYALLVKQQANAQNSKKAELLADYYQAVYLFQVNQLDTALNLIDQFISRYKSSWPYDNMYVKMYGLRGNILLRTARMNELMSHNFDLIKLTEQHKDTLGIARATLGIGNVKLKMKEHNEALNWYHQALHLMANPLYKRKLSFIYNNLAITFYHLSNQDSAVYYVNQGLKYSREDENLTNLANSLFVYAGLMAEFNQLEKAENGYKEALEVRKKIGDIYYLILDMGQLALFYANTNNSEKGIALCKEGLELAEKNGQSFANITSLYEVLARNYKVAGDFKNYSETLATMLQLKDSTYKVNTAEQMAELQTKFDVQKKENTIIRQNLALVKKNYLFYGSLLLLVMASFAAWFIFKSYRRRQKMKTTLMLGEAEERERKRIAADLHDNLGAYAASIVSNLDHIAVTETSANKTALQELRNNSQSIVSQLSDTIWALKKDSLSLTAISDRLKVFIQRIQSSYPDVRIELLEDIAVDHVLPPSQAFHLFQVVQEGINNALRHSNCTSVKVMITGQAQWKITITDNGKGMPAEANKEGNGLYNMKTRSNESGWTIDWQPSSPTGTQVIVEPTTN